MGCWNGTCFVTKLPILYKNQAVGFIVKKVKHRNPSVYSIDDWQPISLPIYGTYNEYGFIENFVHNLPIWLIENLFSDDFDNIIDNIHDQKCMWDGSFVRLIMCHRRIYDFLVTQSVSLFYNNSILDGFEARLLPDDDPSKEIRMVLSKFGRGGMFGLDILNNEVELLFHKWKKDRDNDNVLLYEDLSNYRDSISVSLNSLRCDWVGSISGSGSQEVAANLHLKLLEEARRTLLLDAISAKDAYITMLK